MDDVVGVDVSKADLKVFRLHGNARLCVSNDRMGFMKLRDWLGPTHPQLIVFEVTGAYHRSLESFLHESELPCTKVNPKQARRFSQAVGKLAKTDRVDAEMLARMGRQLDLQAQPAPHENHQILQDLLSARRALIKDRTAAKTRLKVTNLPILKRVLQRRVRQIDEDIKAVEAEMQRLVARDAGYQERAKILATIPGVGWLTAVTMAIEIPELGKLGNKQIAALAGLAPMNQQSGTQDRMRKIQGGRTMDPTHTVHASIGRGSFQSRYETHVRFPHRTWKTSEGCADSDHAEARDTGKCTDLERRAVVTAQHLTRAIAESW